MIRPSLAALALLAVTAAASSARADATAPAPLAQARIDAAAEAYKRSEVAWKAGTAVADSVYSWSVRWYTAQREAGVAGAAAAHLARMRAFEAEVKDRVAAGMASPTDGAGAVYYRAEAEVWAAAGKGK